MNELLYQRLLSSVERTSSGCWRWKKCISTNGYGRISINGKPVFAHRASYETFVGQIDKNKELHHKCSNKLCINPAHLTQITRSQHRIITDVNYSNRNKTHCKRGHEFTNENTLMINGNGYSMRACIECRKIRQEKYNNEAKKRRQLCR